MWVKTQSGQLVNLARCELVKIEHETGFEPRPMEAGRREHWRLVAWSGEARHVLGITESERDAEGLRDVIWNALDDERPVVSPRWDVLVDVRIPAGAAS